MSNKTDSVSKYGKSETQTPSESEVDVTRLVRLVDSHMRMKYRKSLDEMEITNTPGYWRDRESKVHHGHPLHGCIGCDGSFKATYTYFDRAREGGRFVSPTRTWKILKANDKIQP